MLPTHPTALQMGSSGTKGLNAAVYSVLLSPSYLGMDPIIKLLHALKYLIIIYEYVLTMYNEPALASGTLKLTIFNAKIIDLTYTVPSLFDTHSNHHLSLRYLHYTRGKTTTVNSIVILEEQCNCQKACETHGNRQISQQHRRGSRAASR